MRSQLYVFTLLSGLLLTSRVQAQADQVEADANQSQPAAAPPAAGPIAALGPDVIRFKNGDLVRGTIVEKVTGSHVVLLDFAGMPRRFEFSAIEYAGPLEQGGRESAPATTAENAATAPKPTERPQGKIQLRVDLAPNLSLFEVAPDTPEKLRITSAKLVCSGPCTEYVAPGPRRFGIGSRTKARAFANEVFDLVIDSEVQGRFINRKGHRIAGAIAVGAGFPLGFAALFGANYARGSELESTYIGLGAVAAAVVVTGLVLLSQKDRAVISSRSVSLRERADAVQREVAGVAPSAEDLAEADHEALEERRLAVRECVSEATPPVKVRLHIGVGGYPSQIEFPGEESSLQKQCVRRVLHATRYPRGADRTVEHSF